MATSIEARIYAFVYEVIDVSSGTMNVWGKAIKTVSEQLMKTEIKKSSLPLRGLQELG